MFFSYKLLNDTCMYRSYVYICFPYHYLYSTFIVTAQMSDFPLFLLLAIPYIMIIAYMSKCYKAVVSDFDVAGLHRALS